MKAQLNLKEMNKLELAINPNTPAESLAELAKDENWYVRYSAVSNQNTPKNQ